MIILIIHIIFSFDQNISLIFYVKDGSHFRLVFTLPPRDNTLQYKRCVHFWKNFPCITSLSRRGNCSFSVLYCHCTVTVLYCHSTVTVLSRFSLCYLYVYCTTNSFRFFTPPRPCTTPFKLCVLSGFDFNFPIISGMNKLYQIKGFLYHLSNFTFLNLYPKGCTMYIINWDFLNSL